MVIQVHVHGRRGEIKNIDLCETEEQLKRITVKQFREITVKYFPSAMCNEDGVVVFVYVDQRLEDDEFLVSYGIRHMSDIFMVLLLPPETNE